MIISAVCHLLHLVVFIFVLTYVVDFSAFSDFYTAWCVSGLCMVLQSFLHCQLPPPVPLRFVSVNNN